MSGRNFHLPPHRELGDPRRRMIAETEAFLNWAFWRDDVPRVPRRLVSEGGFSRLMREPGAKALVGRWWRTTLEKLQS